MVSSQTTNMIAFLADFNRVQRELVQSWADGMDERMRAYLQKVLEFIDKTPRETKQYDAFSSSTRDDLFRAVCDGIGLARSVCHSTSSNPSQLVKEVHRDSLLVLCELFTLATYLVSKGAAIPTDIPGLARDTREEISDQSVLRAVRELETAYDLRQARHPSRRFSGGLDVAPPKSRYEHATR